MKNLKSILAKIETVNTKSFYFFDIDVSILENSGDYENWLKKSKVELTEDEKDTLLKLMSTYNESIGKADYYMNIEGAIITEDEMNEMCDNHTTFISFNDSMLQFIKE